MKQRITYITAADAAFDPSKQAIVNQDSLSIRSLDAAKEKRFTFTSTELPAEVSASRLACKPSGTDGIDIRRMESSS